jgi:hypothetical protein
VCDHVPRIDGYTLDLIVDFVTCIVVPVIFLHQFHMLPNGASLYIGAFVLFMSALWMSRTDQMTPDHWFNGFPCEWNMIVPTLYLLRANPWLTTAACVTLALTQLTNWKFVHPMQVRRFRPLTVSVTTKTPWPAFPALLFNGGRAGIVAPAQPVLFVEVRNIGNFGAQTALQLAEILASGQSFTEVAKDRRHRRVGRHSFGQQPVGEAVESSRLDVERVQRRTVQQPAEHLVSCRVDPEREEQRQPIRRGEGQAIGVIAHVVQQVAVGLNDTLRLPG